VIARNVHLSFFLNGTDEPRFSRHPINDRPHRQVVLAYKQQANREIESDSCDERYVYCRAALVCI
jgi:hypothetical protein